LVAHLRRTLVSSKFAVVSINDLAADPEE
jgi:hypothetical protein